MITINICDPRAQGPFRTFVHNTTTYVSVPHDAPSQLWVEADEPSVLVIHSCGQAVMSREFERNVTIPLHEIRTPHHQPTGLADIASAVLMQGLLRRPAPPCKNPNHRLYDFTAEVRRLRDGATVANMDVHILCPTDFRVAEDLHLRLQDEPAAIAPDAIWQHAEGKACPQCAQLQAILQGIES